VKPAANQLLVRFTARTGPLDLTPNRASSVASADRGIENPENETVNEKTLAPQRLLHMINNTGRQSSRHERVGSQLGCTNATTGN
jgi:hypothetical protein